MTLERCGDHWRPHIGIDASNLRAGGGITHLVELLRVASPERHEFRQLTVWSGNRTLGRLPERPWLRAVHVPALDRALPWRAFWQARHLERAAAAAGCDVLYAPGGSYTGRFRPAVTMSRNLLPFDPTAARRFGVSAIRFKLAALRYVQSASFRRAAGVIFLTEAARRTVEGNVGTLPGRVVTIPHGIARAMFREPRPQRPIGEYSAAAPFRLLYVSIVDSYKHHVEVAEAATALRAQGYPIVLDLVGSHATRAGAQLRARLARIDPRGEVVRLLGEVPHGELPGHYHEADCFVFASSCENLPNILLEAMAAGLPIACSDRSVMPEVLGSAGEYFDPERPESIAAAIRALLDAPATRATHAAIARAQADQLTWERCARETFAFLRQIADPRAAASGSVTSGYST